LEKACETFAGKTLGSVVATGTIVKKHEFKITKGEPTFFKSSHYGVEGRISWLTIVDDLPHVRTEDDEWQQEHSGKQ
jgi:hypothetical protein